MTAAILAACVAYWIGALADVHSTRIALRFDGVRERNPVARWLIEHVGLIPGLLLKKAAIFGFALVVVKVAPGFGVAFLAAMAGAQLWFGWRNNREIVARRRARLGR